MCVGWSGDVLRSVRTRGRVSRSCAAENTSSKSIDATKRREYFFNISKSRWYSRIQEETTNYEIRGEDFSRELQGEPEVFYSTEIHWCAHGYLYESGRVARKTSGRLLECGRASKFIRLFERCTKFTLLNGNTLLSSHQMIFVVWGATYKDSSKYQT